eukprot:377737-Pyramimonas_sp.AAC.1
MQEIAKTSNIMTSRYVYTWKFVKNDGWDGTHHPTSPGTSGLHGPRSFRCRDMFGNSQRLLASTAACKKQWIIASLDISMALLQGLAYRELAEATGEKERAVCFTLPPGSATALRALPGFENYDESKHCTKDAPRAFSLKLWRTTRGFVLRPTSYDEEFETSSYLLMDIHVDDINMA